MEGGAVTKSQKGRKATRGKESGIIRGKDLDSVQKETHAVSLMIQCLETDANRREKTIVPLLHQK